MSDARAATLAAWREQGMDRLDPLRFHRMQALLQRAAAQQGEARRLLDAKLDALLDAYANELKQASAVDATAAAKAEDGTLATLIEHIAHASTTRDQLFAARNAAPPSSSYPTLEALTEFRKIWSSIRAGSQLRQSLEQVPENAGPLNSAALVHRSIGLMRELSPGYLQQFLSYVDALSWVEQIHAVASTRVDTPRAPSARKRAKAKSRST